MTDELKKCPICGSASELNSLVCSDNGLMYWPNCSNADCCLSDKWEVKSGNREDAVSAWNRRTPEPDTSVIRWTRYDGTPETLPEDGRHVIAKLKRVDYVWAGETDMPFHIPDFRVGDLWSYLPDPPEGME